MFAEIIVGKILATRLKDSVSIGISCNNLDL
jgi:hypothetical protein